MGTDIPDDGKRFMANEIVEVCEAVLSDRASAEYEGIMMALGKHGLTMNERIAIIRLVKDVVKTESDLSRTTDYKILKDYESKSAHGLVQYKRYISRCIHMGAYPDAKRRY